MTLASRSTGAARLPRSTCREPSTVGDGASRLPWMEQHDELMGNHCGIHELAWGCGHDHVGANRRPFSTSSGHRGR